MFSLVSRVLDNVRVSVALLMVEPAGIWERSNESNALRSVPPESLGAVIPAKMYCPAPFENVLLLSKSVLSFAGVSEMVFAEIGRASDSARRLINLIGLLFIIVSLILTWSSSS